MYCHLNLLKRMYIRKQNSEIRMALVIQGSKVPYLSEAATGTSLVEICATVPQVVVCYRRPCQRSPNLRTLSPTYTERNPTWISTEIRVPLRGGLSPTSTRLGPCLRRDKQRMRLRAAARALYLYHSHGRRLTISYREIPYTMI